MTAEEGSESAGEIVSDTGEPVGEGGQEGAVDDGTDADGVQQLLEDALDALRDDDAGE